MSTEMLSIGYGLLELLSQLQNDDTWRQLDLDRRVGGCFDIHSVKPKTVPVVFVAEGSFEKLCDQ